MLEMSDNSPHLHAPQKAGWASGFFVVAALLSVVAMEFFETDLTILLGVGALVSVVMIVGAGVLYRKQKMSRREYMLTFGATAIFIAFTFLNPFIGNNWLLQMLIMAAGLLIATIPYTGELFLAETVALALLAMTLFRFQVVLGVSWWVVFGIFLAVSGALSSLLFVRLENHQEHLRFGWPALFLVTSEIFLILMVTPINIATRTILLGATFYFYTKMLTAKHAGHDPVPHLWKDATILGLLYLGLLLTAHWM